MPYGAYAEFVGPGWFYPEEPGMLLCRVLSALSLESGLLLEGVWSADPRGPVCCSEGSDSVSPVAGLKFPICGFEGSGLLV